MLVLVIPNIETLVVFVFNLRLHIFPGVTKIIFIYRVSEFLKKSRTYWASTLEEAGTGQDTGSLEVSLFTSGFLNNFTLVKVEEVCLTRTFLRLVKFCSSSFKIVK